MGKEKGAAMTSITVREMRRFLETSGYAVQPGKHKHLKLLHATQPPVRLPLQPQMALSLPAARQIAGALGYPSVAALVEAVHGGKAKHHA